MDESCFVCQKNIDRIVSVLQELLEFVAAPYFPVTIPFLNKSTVQGEGGEGGGTLTNVCHPDMFFANLAYAASLLTFSSECIALHSFFNILHKSLDRPFTFCLRNNVFLIHLPQKILPRCVPHTIDVRFTMSSIVMYNTHAKHFELGML